MKSKQEVFDYNRGAWDKQVNDGNQWTLPVSPEAIQDARDGSPAIVLTPTKLVPQEWLGDLTAKDVLCLAGGGGQQAPILAAAGANVTTLDNSQAQLDQDQAVAARENLQVKGVLGQMDDLSCFGDQSFDLVVHPCSNCFTPNVLPVWREAFRVTRPGGDLLAGFGNPIQYIFDYPEILKGNLVVRHKIPYSDFTDLDLDEREKLVADGEPLGFGHSLADQIGGQLAAGFVLSGMYEDNQPQGEDPLSEYIDLFIATRATRPITNASER